MAAASRLTALVGKLKKFHGALQPPPSDAFTLFVWEILTNHSVPAKRDAALKALKRNHALTPDGMWTAPRKMLEDAVARVGPYGEYRLLGLKKGLEIFRRQPELPEMLKGPLPAAMRRVRELPKMGGDSSAYRMLLFAGKHPVLPVDGRVHRVATRLGYGEMTEGDFSKSARSIREAVAPELPPSVDAWQSAYIYLEHHGATTCPPTDPHCDECPLLKDCHFSRSQT